MTRGASQKLVNASVFLNTIPIRVSEIFHQVQLSSSNHHRNKITLHKIFQDAISIRKATTDGYILTGLRKFEQIIFLMIVRLLETKKGAAGDRVVKFFVEFLKYTHEKGYTHALSTMPHNDPIDEDEPESDDLYESNPQMFTMRLVNELLKNGSTSRNNNARYRSAELCANIALGLVQIHESIYFSFREILLDRINDKDWNIRQQAAAVLCAFQRVEDSEELKDRDLSPLSGILLETLSYDIKEDVRLAIVNKLDINDNTIDDILSRTRDAAVRIRKEVYSVLEKNVVIGEENDEDDELEMGSTHLKTLTTAQRDLIIQNGLGDRDPGVRDSAVKLFTKWVKTIAMENASQERPQGNLQETNLVQVLALFNLCANNSLSEVIAKMFETNLGILNDISFDNMDWLSFSPEIAFLVRVYIEHCAKNKHIGRLDEVFPVIMDFAIYLQEYFNAMIDAFRRYQEEASDADLDDVARAILQDEIDNQAFITCEMLKMSIHLDYGDEVGRRKLDQLIREFLVHKDLPDGLIVPCVNLLKEVTANERDLICIINDNIIPSLYRNRQINNVPFVNSDAINVTPPSLSSRERRARKDLSNNDQANDIVNMRCLSICESMLVLVDAMAIEDSSSVRAIVDLVYSAAFRKTDDKIKEKGFRCFALIGLLNDSVAVKALKFFLKHMKNRDLPEELRLLATQATFDLLLWYGQAKLVEWCNAEKLIVWFVNALEKEHSSEDMRALLCEGLAKLMNEAVLVDERITTLLVNNYFSPEYTENQKLKQCLSFFFYNYCSFLPDNQVRISKAFMPTFLKLCSMHRKGQLDSEFNSVALVTQFADMILTWTHPNEQEKLKKHGISLDTRAHFDLVFEIVKKLLKDPTLLKEHKRILFDVLSHKIYLPDKVNDDEVGQLYILIEKIPSFYPFPNVSSRKAFAKFQVQFTKKYEEQLEASTEPNFSESCFNNRDLSTGKLRKKRFVMSILFLRCSHSQLNHVGYKCLPN
ncbi:nuclear condensing complex subunit [Lentinula aciculospora]|uniref:Nuclear condensing complex subunit n=1 Tax=Lentinula aciculospora TaxID=153920 RepID=A0A9W9AT43_9AGAR|nr:nuclear condensing complex subunit [Lentinula aciculospora]